MISIPASKIRRGDLLVLFTTSDQYFVEDIHGSHDGVTELIQLDVYGIPRANRAVMTYKGNELLTVVR